MKMDGGSPIKTGRSATGAENQPDVRILTGRMTAMLGELEDGGDTDEDYEGAERDGNDNNGMDMSARRPDDDNEGSDAEYVGGAHPALTHSRQHATTRRTTAATATTSSIKLQQHHQ